MVPEEFESSLKISIEAFCKKNPVLCHLGLEPKEFESFVRSEHSISKDITNGLSLVARWKGRKEPLAFLFVSGFDLGSRTPAMESVLESNPKLKVMREWTEKNYETACIGSLLSNGLTLGSMTSGKSCYATLGGTYPGWEGQGLGKKLRMRAVQVARERGYNSLIVEPIHGGTRHIWTKYCGAEVIAELNFDDFRSPSKVLGERPTRAVEGSCSICQVLLRSSWKDTPLLSPFFIIRFVAQAGELKNAVRAVKWLVSGD
eukprot:g3080.t1